LLLCICYFIFIHGFAVFAFLKDFLNCRTSRRRNGLA
jgi:hypothetical protein